MAIQAQLEQVAAAFDRQDYKMAAQLLQPLLQEAPDNGWVQLYAARLQEASGKLDMAEAAYRKLLRYTRSATIALQARQNLQRMEDTARAQRQEAIAQSVAHPSDAAPGFLILESISPEAKQTAIQSFARIMKLDPYTARIHLSHRGWKVYRTGAIGELKFYGQELQQAGIPVFWATLADIETIRVFRVQYVQSASPHITLICQNETDQLGTLTLNWSEVEKRVEGMLPIFEDVIDVGIWNKLQRKEQTQDYAQVLDLHLTKRKCILRFCDNSYQFQRGMIFDATQTDGTRLVQTTNRIRWNNLTKFIHTRLDDTPKWSEFTPFGETALEHLALVNRFPSYIDLFRKNETYWDEAFHLYSGLAFLRNED